MVVLVRHALVDGAISLNVDNVARLVRLEVGGQLDGALGAEVARKEVPGAGAQTKGVGHFSCSFLFFSFLYITLREGDSLLTP